MNWFDIDAARCEALFVSGLQSPGDIAGDAVGEAIRRAVREFGIRGCGARVAQEFGDHPDTAVARMRWARRVVAQTYHARPRTIRVAPSPRAVTQRERQAA